MEQYPIPQFIEDEAKIIFFLTFKQFFLLVGGGAACLLLYFVVPFSVFIICAGAIMLLVLAIGFLKINGMPVLTVCLNFIGYLAKSKTYTWRKEELKSSIGIQKHYEVGSMPEPYVSTLKTQNSKLKDIKKIIETKK